MIGLQEPLRHMFSRSQLLVLDFSKIAVIMPKSLDIRQFFEECTRQGINPRLPANRQKFNNRVLTTTGARYLVSRYAEDRSAMLVGTKIASEGRTYHLGIDIFSKNQETVYAPCDGMIVETNYEPGFGEYGHYLILKPDKISQTYIFFGHLSSKMAEVGTVKAGDRIGKLGDYKNNENGGWSRHLHMQVMQNHKLGAGPPIGYSSKENLLKNRALFPDPMAFFPDWKPQFLQ